MKEIKLIIDGKEVKPTEEQLKQFEIELEGKRKNPFERVGSDDKYYYAIVSGDVLRRVDINDRTDRRLYNAINYFNDRRFANQVALHQLLYNKLLKFAYDNECEDKEWNGTNVHVYIIYNSTKKDYDTRWTRDEKEPGTVYFKSTAWATAALNEVVVPFVKEHPDFVW